MEGRGQPPLAVAGLFFVCGARPASHRSRYRRDGYRWKTVRPPTTVRTAIP
jgi:hypothetical protein